MSLQPNIYFADAHGIDPTLLDPHAVAILERLRDAGFAAYLVGGSVRDLLVKARPKDFDISTSARPEEIKQLFGRQCILIGRRFRLAHIRFSHNKIIEVATFRAGESGASDLITHDNEWGSEVEDVLRRDFTINGLFYDVSNHSVIDYVGGWGDVQKQTLRTIGNPEVRFKQDPVRLLRMLKFQARFGFGIDPETQKAAQECRQEIVKSSPARILEEMLRMLESGASARFFQLLAEYGILASLFPALNKFLNTPRGKAVYHFLSNADKLHQHKGKNTLDRAVLTACLLFPVLEKEIEIQYVNKGRTPHLGDISLMTAAIIKEFLISSFSHFPRRLTAITAAILVSQYRFTPLSGKRHFRERLFHHKEFQHTLQFLKLRAMVDENLVDIYLNIRNQARLLFHPRHHNKS